MSGEDKQGPADVHPRFGRKRKLVDGTDDGSLDGAVGEQSEAANSPVETSTPRASSSEAGLRIASSSESIAYADTASLSDEGRYIQAGQELAALFKDRNVHPVVVVGSRGAGKTTILASLLKYAMFSVDAGGTATLMEDLYPGNSEIWKGQLIWAKQLVEKTVASFDNSFAPPPTTTSEPFFVPITFTQSDGRFANIAFLESMGELYMLQESGDSPHKKFHSLLASFLNSYTGEISILYVAPVVTGEVSSNGALESSSSKEMTARDLAMFGVIGQYISQRRGMFNRDRHLLLMSKWDVLFKTLSEPDLVDPPPERIELVLAARYPKTWAKFSSIPMTEPAGSKRFSVYSAGMMFESRVLAASSEDRPKMDRFPRKVWDWLWLGAVGTHLFSEFTPRKPNPLDRMINWLRGR
jgi:hypothetical protein